MSEMILAIDHVRAARERYVTMAARVMMEEIRKISDPYEQEQWLARKMNIAFGEYHGHLEKMCNSYATMAGEALATKVALPFSIKAKP